MSFPARYPGLCARTGKPIRPGDIVQRVGHRRYALIERSRPVTDDRPVSDADVVRDIDPELYDSDPESAESAGRYLRQSIARGVSDIWSANGREYYRNRSGLCEDAPCCGCCNA